MTSPAASLGEVNDQNPTSPTLTLSHNVNFLSQTCSLNADSSYPTKSKF
ncbi:hypothetical protein CCACVL1_25126 [Corchorus capsularis]|uniref:Uncharacterized protein n=1 Tax=Corchorus capsularis TaxID=210143 RepID=A0A1R3GLT9_COCAP|nr:hypothetical protein CCACVL1_25126 [Corchorus capsularis]